MDLGPRRPCERKVIAETAHCLLRHFICSGYVRLTHGALQWPPGLQGQHVGYQCVLFLMGIPDSAALFGRSANAAGAIGTEKV